MYYMLSKVDVQAVYGAKVVVIKASVSKMFHFDQFVRFDYVKRRNMKIATDFKSASMETVRDFLQNCIFSY